MLALRVIKCNKVLGQLLWLERFCNSCSTNWTDCQPLLLNFDKAHLAKSMAAVEVPRNAVNVVKVFVTRGTVH